MFEDLAGTIWEMVTGGYVAEVLSAIGAGKLLPVVLCEAIVTSWRRTQDSIRRTSGKDWLQQWLNIPAAYHAYPLWNKGRAQCLSCAFGRMVGS